MKRILLFFIFCSLPLFLSAQSANKNGTNWEKLIYAIEEHESKHNPNTKSQNGKYWGMLQISNILVKECNNILGINKYTSADRLNPQKSYEIFNIIQNKYNPKHDHCLAVRLWAVGLVALRNPRAGIRMYKEINAIYRKL